MTAPPTKGRVIEPARRTSGLRRFPLHERDLRQVHMRRVAVFRIIGAAEPLHRLTQHGLEKSNVFRNEPTRLVPVFLQIELDALRGHEIIVTSVAQVALMNEHIRTDLVVSGDKAVTGLGFPSPYCSGSHDKCFHNPDDENERAAGTESLDASRCASMGPWLSKPAAQRVGSYGVPELPRCWLRIAASASLMALFSSALVALACPPAPPAWRSMASFAMLIASVASVLGKFGFVISMSSLVSRHSPLCTHRSL